MKAKKVSSKPEPDATLMPLPVAERIRELRTGRVGNVIHSWRRIAEVICEEYPKQISKKAWGTFKSLHGNQLYGIDLCREAAEVLGEDANDWEDEIGLALEERREIIGKMRTAKRDRDSGSGGLSQ